MKNIYEFISTINEAGKETWSISDETGGPVKSTKVNIKSDAKYININTEGNSILFCSEKDVESWIDDFGEEFEEDIKNIKALKVGEVYDADGGINLYIRIK